MMSTNSVTRLSRSLRCVSPLYRSTPSPPTANELFLFRTYTNPHDSIPSSLLTSALGQKQRASSREDSVGPFQLGISQTALRCGEKAKRWSELTVGGKLIRTTQRTTNLTVILLGAGLSIVLVYALTSELFSKNSPTVLYNDACERIKSSPRVAKYLHTPLTFHNNPPSSVRPRHRHRHVASQIAIDSLGREHLLLNFYVQGSASSIPTVGDERNIQWVDYVDSLASLTFEDVREGVSSVIESVRSAFKYLRGDAVPVMAHSQTTTKEKSKEQENGDARSWWGLTGMFAGLRGWRSYGGESAVIGTTWTEGEVHAHLVRNDEGYFVFRYLLIDIPNSGARNSIRVFVERAPGVRENEPIMRLHSS